HTAAISPSVSFSNSFAASSIIEKRHSRSACQKASLGAYSHANSSGKWLHICGSLSLELKSIWMAPGTSCGGSYLGSKPTTGTHPTRLTSFCWMRHQAGLTLQQSQGLPTPAKMFFHSRAASKTSSKGILKYAQLPVPALQSACVCKSLLLNQNIHLNVASRHSLGPKPPKLQPTYFLFCQRQCARHNPRPRRYEPSSRRSRLSRRFRSVSIQYKQLTLTTSGVASPHFMRN